jgi:hypothetical protein
MNASKEDPPKSSTYDPWAAVNASLIWGSAVLPFMFVTEAIVANVGAMLGVAESFYFIAHACALVVCAACGRLAGRTWRDVRSSLVANLPISCVLGGVVWIVFGVVATLGQSPNAKWYGVPEGIVTALVFLLASLFGAKTGRKPIAKPA